MQSYRFVQSSLPDDCIEFYLSSDLLKEGYYHFLALWNSESAMNNFLNSPGYDFLHGAFIALGNLENQSNGLWMENKVTHKMN
jgi:quinol monooxygenase YgiN